MSVHKIRSYLDVLLASDISKQQLRCLLATANERQLDGLRQIFYNAYYTNAFKLAQNDYMKILKHSSILNVVCNTTKYTYQRRLGVIRKHLRIIIKMVQLLRLIILTI